ncbi:unnamed protein product [Acanthocheilonema viteae]|uniref:Uncharacterized protein n=1 Tax=Acanthocheilonema viteae TaxID=6277 RepID=A0A498S8V8_ACAVI|nr:unnamed protein product [Acanthocheilonema viteae]
MLIFAMSITSSFACIGCCCGVCSKGKGPPPPPGFGYALPPSFPVAAPPPPPFYAQPRAPAPPPPPPPLGYAKSQRPISYGVQQFEVAPSSEQNRNELIQYVG